jgi:hypothetical protein
MQRGTPREEPTSVALHFVGRIFNCISMVLARRNIKTVGLLLRKATSFLWPVKDDPGFETLSIYSIPHECIKVYIGQTRYSIET